MIWERPNLVLVLVDTLRADHLPVYGYFRDTSPAISSIANQAVVFRSIYAQAPFTPPSVASLMTSTYPSTHGVTYPPSQNMRYRPLPESIPTLAETLRTAGYHTVAVSSHPWITAKHGFAKGFSTFEVVPHTDYAENRHLEPMLVVERALRLMNSAPSQPFFMYLHLMGPHWPYKPEAEHDIFQRAKQITPLIRELDAIPAGWMAGLEFLEEREREGSVTADDAEILTARYDGMIRQTDAALRPLFQSLRSNSEFANTVIVLTADHGEEFLEHGGLFHSTTLYNELLHIPLVISNPTAFPGRRYDDRLAESIDIPATIAEIAGADVPPSFKGESLFAGDKTELAVSEISGGRKIQSSKWSVIERNGHIRMFDLARDSRELKDVAIKHQGTAQELLAQADSRIDSLVPEDQELILEEGVGRQLMALGYLGNATVRFSADPNPIVVCDGSGVGVTKLNWDAQDTTSLLEVRVGSPTGKVMARSKPKDSATTGKWVRNGMKFFLIEVATGETKAHTTVRLTSAGCVGG